MCPRSAAEIVCSAAYNTNMSILHYPYQFCLATLEKNSSKLCDKIWNRKPAFETLCVCVKYKVCKRIICLPNMPEGKTYM